MRQLQEDLGLFHLYFSLNLGRLGLLEVYEWKSVGDRLVWSWKEGYTHFSVEISLCVS